MWAVQLSGVIGAVPLVAAAAALLWRLCLAAALAIATLLKVSLKAVAKTFVQRGRPAKTLSEVILRGKAAAHGLSFPSGHAMVIFAIATLVAPYLKSWWKVLPWALAAAVCLSRVYLGAHFPLDIAAGRPGRVHRGRAEPPVRRAQRQPQHSPVAAVRPPRRRQPRPRRPPVPGLSAAVWQGGIRATSR
jgi:PAP2 superfamily